MIDSAPQEIEVRYILPAVRRELARIFVGEHNLSQKEAADILGLTEAAVSQYQHSKRAKGVIFSNSIVNELRESAGRILADRQNRQRLIAEIYRITNLTNVKHLLCNIHRSQSKGLGSCSVCFD